MAKASPLDRLNSSERQAVVKCLTLIRERQISSGTAKGAFRVATNADSTWLEQYFALEAVIAVLAATDDPKGADTKRVADYLTYYAKQCVQEPEGIAHNFEGKITDPQPIVLKGEQKIKGPFGDHDSIDAAAGLFLVASARYYKLTKQLPPHVTPALVVSLNAINRVINHKREVSRSGGFNPVYTSSALTNGLPIARASRPQSKISDTVEACAGLMESIPLFMKLGKVKEAKLAQKLVNGIARGIALYAPPAKNKLYVYLIDRENRPHSNGDLYPGILNNLIALSYFPQQSVQAHREVWGLLQRTTPDDDSEYPDLPKAPSEHWLIAATRIEPDITKVMALRRKVVANTKQFDHETYIGRLAVTTLALIGKPARYPLVPSLTRN